MKTIWIILLSACVGGLLTMMLTRSCQNSQVERVEIVKTDTLTITRVDTVTIVKPQPYKVEVKDTVYIEKDYTGYVLVQETKWFGDGETYDMQVSGINVELDWIKTYPKTITETITETRTETIYIEPKPLSLWISASYIQIGKENSLPLTVEARYSKKNEEYFIGGGYDVLQNNKVIEFGGRKRF